MLRSILRPIRALLVLPLPLACGDDGGPATPDVSTSHADTDPAATAGTTAASGSTEPDGGTADGTAETGDPPGPACGDGTGCAPALWQPDGATRGSSIPGGCGEGPFSLRWSWEVPGIDAAKAVPHLVDANGDGALDLLMSARKTDGLVFLGQGDGTFAEPGTMGVSFLGGWAFDAGDVDGDGAIDLVLGDHNHGALLLTGSGNGSFSGSGASLIEGTYSGAGLGDLDGDGTLDAVFGADQFNSGYAVALGDGTGLAGVDVTGMPAFGAGGPANNGVIRFADLDLDDDLDVIAFGQGAAGTLEAHPFLNDGTGTGFTASGSLAGSGGTGTGIPIQGSVGDFDCDGYPDVASGGTLWRGGASGFVEGPTVDTAMIATFADLDGNGWLDVITHSPDGGLRAFMGDGTALVGTDLGLPGPEYVPAEHTGDMGLVPLDDALGIDVDDLDGDGDLEIVRWYKLSIPGAFGTETTFHRLEVWAR
jgi:hypothetical protein